MGPIFEANERVKELMVLKFNASKARTILHKNGTHFLSDPFLETEIFWNSPKDFNKIPSNELVHLSEEICNLRDQVEDLGGQMTPPLFELRNKNPMLVWAQFFTRDVTESS